MTFNSKKYNATRKQVLKFLEKNPLNNQSIVIKGKEGVGKSRILNELSMDFDEYGYKCIDGLQSPTRVTRTLTSKKVFAWDDANKKDLDLTKDDRFVVFSI